VSIIVNGVTLPEYNDPADVPAAMRNMANGLLPLVGGTMSGIIDMGGQRIVGLGSPIGAGDSVPKQYVDAALANVTWGAIQGKPATFPPDNHTHPQYAPTHTHPYASSSHPASADHDGRYYTEGESETRMQAWAATASQPGHGHGYLPTGGGTITGNLTVQGSAGFGADISNIGAAGTSDTGLPVWRGDGNRTFLLHTSSGQFKDNIQDAETTGIIERLLRLRPVTFVSKLEADPDTPMLGLIAEEVHEVMPEVTSGHDSKTGMTEHVSYDGLVVPLLIAVQALWAKVYEHE
jgi:Chaperone of endosialidase